jgi:hypothetical protein
MRVRSPSEKTPAGLLPPGKSIVALGGASRPWRRISADAVDKSLVNILLAKILAGNAVSQFKIHACEFLAEFSKEPLIKCAFYDPTFPQGLKPIDSLSFMYGLKPVPFKSPT